MLKRAAPLLVVVGLALGVALASANAAADSRQTYCVRVSEAVGPEQLNRLVATGKVDIEVVANSPCHEATEPAAVGVAAQRAYIEFLLHSIEAMESLNAALAASRPEASWDSVEWEGNCLLGWVLPEIDWLDSNPPSPCFAAVHAGLRDVIGLMEESGRGMLEAAVRQDPELALSSLDIMTGVAPLPWTVNDQAAVVSSRRYLLSNSAGDR